MNTEDNIPGSSRSQRSVIRHVHRHTIDVIQPDIQRPPPQKRYSEDAILFSARPIPGPSSVRIHPTLHSQATYSSNAEHNDDLVNNHTRRGLIDSGFITTSPISQSQRSSTMDTSPRSFLIPPTEDRPDLWQVGQTPPTFRPRTSDEQPPREQETRRNQSSILTRYVRRVLQFFGYTPRNRYEDERLMVSVTIGFEFILFSAALGLLIFTAIRRSPVQTTISEWRACNKPLGIWDCFWLAKVALDCTLYYWNFRLDWKKNPNGRPDIESGTFSPRRRTDSPITPISDRSNSTRSSRTQSQGSNDRRPRQPKAYARLSLLLSTIVLAWFISTNIFIFTSVNTCRVEAPHLWWLSFALLMLQYIRIIEIIITIIVLLIIAPLLFLIINLFLFCIGRHPAQNPDIRPEIGKLSKKIVDKIPLVIYIPAPPEKEGDGKGKGKSDAIAPPAEQITKPEPAHVAGREKVHEYPPKSGSSTPSRRRFAFLRRKTSGSKTSDGSSSKKGGKVESRDSYEALWETGDYPFVKLDENRATCAICLLDFMEPKKRVANEVIASWSKKDKEDEGGESKEGGNKDQGRNEEKDKPASSGDTPSNGANAETNKQDQALRLEAVEEGAQPLRLLECGHVFHMTCIDPWLIDVSGRCPTCQRPIIDPKDKQ